MVDVSVVDDSNHVLASARNREDVPRAAGAGGIGTSILFSLEHSKISVKRRKKKPFFVAEKKSPYALKSFCPLEGSCWLHFFDYIYIR